MKNQTHQTWLWQGLMATALLMTVGASNAFAGASSCANPSEITLDGHLEGQVKMKFCDIPAAQGVMIGSENGESDEKPVKARNFKNFQMAQFEVTQLQYKTVTGGEPWKENGEVKFYVQEGNDNPAVYISYNDAVEFARILSLIDKTATYRLPTEAEFEYAARAGTTTNYYWGDEVDSNFAYFGGDWRTGPYARKVDSCPTPILNQKYPGYCANDFGLYHMLGNVSEWTADAYDENSYANASTDGNVAVVGDTDSYRVVRGGGWLSDAEDLRSSNRGYGYGASDGLSHDVGFRLVRIAK